MTQHRHGCLFHFNGLTFTFDLQNLIRPSSGASEYSLYVSLRLFKPFMRYRGNKIYPDEQTDECSGWTA